MVDSIVLSSIHSQIGRKALIIFLRLCGPRMLFGCSEEPSACHPDKRFDMMPILFWM
jgi:hypothetical protein